MKGGANNIINKEEKRKEMANIQNLQMWNSICNNSCISVKSSLFGLKTTAIYQPTQSAIKVETLEYNPETGDKLKRIIESPKDELDKAIGLFRPQPTVNGNYLLEKLSSQDGQFTALQLLQFHQLSYEPVTEVLLFEGKDAEVINKLF